MEPRVLSHGVFPVGTLLMYAPPVQDARVTVTWLVADSDSVLAVLDPLCPAGTKISFPPLLHGWSNGWMALPPAGCRLERYRAAAAYESWNFYVIYDAV